MLGKLSVSFLLSIVALAIGFVNQILISKTFGTAPVLDAYWIAMALVNFACFYVHPLRDAIVPNFYSVQGNRPEASEYASSVISLNFYLSVLALLVGGSIAYIGQSFLRIENGNGAWLLICLTPAVIFISMSEIVLGFIAALNLVACQGVVRVIPPAFTFILILFFGDSIGIFVLPAAVVAANLFSSIFSILVLRKSGITIRLCRPRQALKYKARPMLATLLGVYLIAQVHILIERAVFSQAGPGVISAFQYAAAIVNTLVGLVTAPLISVVWPRFLGLGKSVNQKKMAELLGDVLLFVGLLLTAICIFIFKNASAIVYVVFARGGFDYNAANITATALMFLVFGAVPACLNQIVGRVINSQQNLKGAGLSGLGMALSGIAIIGVGWWTDNYAVAMSHWMVANLVGAFLSLWLSGKGGGRETIKVFERVTDWIKAGLLVGAAYFIAPSVSVEGPKEEVFLEMVAMFCAYFAAFSIGISGLWWARLRLFVTR